MSSRLESSHAKICKLDIVVPVQQDVLRLQVTMANVESMAVSKTGNDLTEETNGFLFWERAILGNVVEQFTSFHILKNKIPGTD